MQVIHLHHPYQASEIPDGKVVLAMGFFDGLHLGHQKVIKQAKTIAKKKGLPLAVLTYDHHPAVVYRPMEREDTLYLTSKAEKLNLLEQMGVDRVFVVQFTANFAAQTPQTFVDDYLIGFHVDTVVAGFDHTYGPKEIATMANMAKFAHGRFEVVTIDRLADDGMKVSSTRERQALDAGDTDQVMQLIGRPFETKGLVVHGEARGRTLGFPTANVLHNNTQWLPGIGIYTAQVSVDQQQWYAAMISVGRNVTFGDHRPVTVEVNVLGFEGNLYGETMTIRWYHRLRGEVKFSGAEALVTQLKQDQLDTENYFKTLK